MQNKFLQQCDFGKEKRVNTLPTVKHGGRSIAQGHRKYCASERKNGFRQILRNSRG